MFIDENKKEAPQIAEIARQIKPDEIQIVTPLRQPSAVKPLSPYEIKKIKAFFKGFSVISAYDKITPNISPISIKDTKKRRGN